MQTVLDVLQMALPVAMLIGIGQICRTTKLMSEASIDGCKALISNILIPIMLFDLMAGLELSGEMVRLPFYEIRYLDVHQNYVTVHAKSDYTVKRTLGDFEKELDDRFCRVGRGMILNLKYIQRVTKTEVRLSDGTVLPLPRGAYEPLNRAIIQHT